MSSVSTTRRTAAAALAVAGLAGAGVFASADAAAPLPQLAISSAGTAKHPTFTAPATAVAGPTEITYSNGTSGESNSGQLVNVDGVHTDAQVLSALGKAEKGKAVPSWFHGAAGPGSVPKGKKSTAIVNLKAGTYYVLGGAQGSPKAPLPKITVTGTSTAALPKATGTIAASEYTFKGSNVKAGRPLLLRNNGMQWHHFLAARLKKGATLKQAKKFLLSDGKKVKSPYADKSFFASAVLDPGYEEVVTAPKKAGRYVFFCYLSDKSDGGPPHVAKGMVKIITVK